MVGKYRNERITLLKGNTGMKVSIALLVGKYRNESEYHNNGREIQEQK